MTSRQAHHSSPDPRIDHILGQISGGYTTVGEMTYEVIKRAILSGTFAPGERLRQEYLAAAIGVSRLPVRNALLQLEAEGLVTLHPHRRGARVRALSAAQIDEVYNVRSVLETYALRVSMTRMTEERIELLRSLAAQLDAKPEGEGFVDVRIKFYRALYDADNNPILVQLVEQLRGRVGRHLLTFRFDGQAASRHGDLIERVASGDQIGAEAWILDHLAGVRRGLRSLMTQVGATDSDETADLGDTSAAGRSA